MLEATREEQAKVETAPEGLWPTRCGLTGEP